MKKPVIDEWTGCYPSNWKGLIVPDAIKHPAKFSSKLISHIYDHMVAQGWVQPGDTVLDPFGGVGLGAFDAMRLGLRWRGIELEANFADLGNQNIALWNHRFSRMPHWCQDAVCFHGDSRKLLSILQEVEGAVSSPPYADSMERKGGFDPEKSKHAYGPNSQMVNANTGYSEVAGAVSSPPYAEARIGQESGQEQCGRGDQYGATEGQLGAMRADGFDAAISSPPFMKQQEGHGIADALKGIGDYESVVTPTPGRVNQGYQNQGQSEGQLGAMKGDDFDAAVSSPPFLQARGGTPEPKEGSVIDAGVYARHAAGNAAANGYGDSEGQLSSMKDDGFDGAVTSPPYEASFNGQHDARSREDREAAAGHKLGGGQIDHARDYGNTDGQLGIEAGDSFWLSARTIVDQVYAALKPGAHAVWVLKGFVKAHRVVDFPGQWQQLCEAAGFETVHIHHAMLTNKRGASYTLDGGTVEHKTEAKSFFRRNGENKARARKWWDTCDLSRDCKAEYLWKAKKEKWIQWLTDILKHQEDGRVIKKPKAFIVRGLAQMMAYRDAGEPEIKIETSIDYETVLCMRKPEGV